MKSHPAEPSWAGAHEGPTCEGPGSRRRRMPHKGVYDSTIPWGDAGLHQLLDAAGAGGPPPALGRAAIARGRITTTPPVQGAGRPPPDGPAVLAPRFYRPGSGSGGSATV
jgi:hypothetical protein